MTLPRKTYPLSSCLNSERATQMRNGKRGRYTLEFKQEAVRLLESGQGIAAAARSLGVVEQTLSNWVKAHREGTLKQVDGKVGVTAEQMEISRLRAELARVRMERDILPPQRRRPVARGPRPGKSDGILRKGPEVKYALHRTASASLADLCAVPGAESERLRLPPTPGASPEDCSAPPLEQRSAVGAYSCRVCRIPRSLRLASHLAEVLKRGVRVGKLRVQRIMQQHGSRLAASGASAS
jgi:transposase